MTLMPPVMPFPPTAFKSYLLFEVPLRHLILREVPLATPVLLCSFDHSAVGLSQFKTFCGWDWNRVGNKDVGANYGSGTVLGFDIFAIEVIKGIVTFFSN